MANKNKGAHLAAHGKARSELIKLHKAEYDELVKKYAAQGGQATGGSVASSSVAQPTTTP